MRGTAKGEKTFNQYFRAAAMFCAVLILAISATQVANAATFTVSNLTDTGAGSLREAITQANSNANPATQDTINFSVSGTINLLTPLPPITEPVFLNGGGTPTIELNGAGVTGVGNAAIGLYLRAGNSVIQGFIINRFTGDAGIRMDSDSVGTDNGNTLLANRIGTNTTGTAALPNFNRGVLIVGTTLHTIGDGTTGGRNLISGNSGRGIEITAGGSASIRGNYIGTNAAGTGDLGNTAPGIQIVNSSNSTIGLPGAGNVISGNNANGINIIGDIGTPASANQIVGNLIGVNAAGTAALANSGSGISIQGSNNFVGPGNVISGNVVNGVAIGSSLSTGNFVIGNLIGVGTNGTTAIGNTNSGVRVSNLAAGNTIGGANVTIGSCDNSCNVIGNNGASTAFDARAGVYIDSTAGVGNTVRANSIFANGETGTTNGLGIDIGAPGATANDAGDPDSGANNLQNKPALTATENSGSITGTLNSTPSTSFRIDFYRSVAGSGDTAVNSEGRTYIGATTVSTAASGDIAFTYNTTATLSSGNFVTATATNIATKDTSEFSNVQTVVDATGNAGAGRESDVAPRPNGDNQVDPTDVVQVRRFQIGLDDENTTTNEFQRADASPLSSRGDGSVDATDVVQARRYQVGLDPAQPASGPTQPSAPFTEFAGFAGSKKSGEKDNFGGQRVIRVVNQTTSPGNVVTVPIQVDALGDEASYGFSLDYNSAILSSPNVQIGTAGGNVLSNTNTAGKIGFSVDFGGSTIAAGNNQLLVKISFNVTNNAPPGTTPLVFSDTPAIRKVSDTGANSLPATFTDGNVNITAAVRQVRVVDATANAGNQVTVQIAVNAQGDEASYGFSLNYDNSILSNPMVVIGTAGGNVLANTNTAGQIGFSVDFGGSTIAAGNNQILVTVKFNVDGGAPTGATPLTFGDVPAIRKVSDTNANALPTSFINGNVNIIGAVRQVRVVSTSANVGSQVTVQIAVDAQGDEASYGFSLNYDQNILSSPNVQIGTAGGNVLANPNTAGRIGFSVDFGGGTIAAGNNQILVTITFNVSSSAPEGDTPLTFSDVPAIRRVSDTNAMPLATDFIDGVINIISIREVRVIFKNTSQGSQVILPLEVDALGDESTYGFSLNYEPTKLSNPVVMQGSNPAGITFNNETPGQLGISVDFSGGAQNLGGVGTIPAGFNQILINVRFDVATTAPTGLTPVTFGDTPAIRIVSDSNSQPLATRFIDNFVNIAGTTAASATVVGNLRTANGNPIVGAFVKLTDITSGESFTVRTNAKGVYRFNDIAVGESYILTPTSKRYVFNPQSKVVSVDGDIKDTVFVAAPRE